NPSSDSVSCIWSSKDLQDKFTPLQFDALHHVSCLSCSVLLDNYPLFVGRDAARHQQDTLPRGKQKGRNLVLQGTTNYRTLLTTKNNMELLNYVSVAQISYQNILKNYLKHDLRTIPSQKMYNLISDSIYGGRCEIEHTVQIYCILEIRIRNETREEENKQKRITNHTSRCKDTVEMATDRPRDDSYLSQLTTIDAKRDVLAADVRRLTTQQVRGAAKAATVTWITTATEIELDLWLTFSDEDFIDAVKAKGPAQTAGDTALAASLVVVLKHLASDSEFQNKHERHVQMERRVGFVAAILTLLGIIFAIPGIWVAELPLLDSSSPSHHTKQLRGQEKSELEREQKDSLRLLHSAEFRVMEANKLQKTTTTTITTNPATTTTSGGQPYHSGWGAGSMSINTGGAGYGGR
ncbi:hypothetical protein PROFUN_16938, partial [Planoprotostelium fungivorum]